jgi:hypothetical protein
MPWKEKVRGTWMVGVKADHTPDGKFATGDTLNLRTVDSQPAGEVL